MRELSQDFGRFGSIALLACALVALPSACNRREQSTAPAGSAAASASAGPRKLTPELAQKVLAKVGDREITLGDYAATIERMDPFERLRYQSPERRKQLLEEIIQVELLAQEAKRRKLDQSPETQERIRQMLRDELLREVRNQVPAPAEIPEPEVRAYFDQNRDEFREPERRRVAHIVVGSAAQAKALLAKVKGAGAAEWGKHVNESSLDKPPKQAGSVPVELAGDLGIVGPPGHPRGGNPAVPEPLRAAVFKIEKIGDVLDEVVEHQGRFHIVRMTGRTEARDRSYAEAERAIRVTLVQQKIREREAELDRELRRKYPVTIDDAALGKIALPAPSASGNRP